MKSHIDYYNPGRSNHSFCNRETGLIETERALGPEMNEYFGSVGFAPGCTGDDLLNVPKEQPILWSMADSATGQNNPMGGLGVQLKWGVDDPMLDNLREQPLLLMRLWNICRE
jgi:hypothetical protein